MPAHLWGWLPHDRSWLAAATQFPGTVFFNISTAAALTHNATAAESDRYVWRPDLFGSVLFLVASAYGILAVSRRFLSLDPASMPWRIAWINMLGSVLFMASALASYVLPSTDELLEHPRRGRRHPARCGVLPRRRRTDAPRVAPGPRTRPRRLGRSGRTLGPHHPVPSRHPRRSA